MLERSLGRRSVGLAVLVAASAVFAAAPCAAAPPQVKHFTAQELESAVMKTQAGLVSANLATGDGGPTVLIVRRDGPADVELHQVVDDVFVAHAGSASVLVGGTVTGQHELAPTEWRGGKISGAQSYTLATGDVLFIPAGLPHQVVVPPGGSFSYLALKFPARRGAQ